MSEQRTMVRIGQPSKYDGLSAKHVPEARICSGCAAIIERGDEIYPDNHWPWCPGGKAVDITPEAVAAATPRAPAPAVAKLDWYADDHDAEPESWEGPGVDVKVMIEAANERRRATGTS